MVYEFGPFRLDPVKRLLWREGANVTIQPKAMDLLVALIQGRGQVLEKEALMTKLWPDSIVEESNLTVSMSVLRKALGETAQEHRFIVTIPGRGYRFAADVREIEEGKEEVVLQQSTRLSVVVEEDDDDSDRETEGQRATSSALLPLLSISLSLRRTLLLATVLLALLSISLVYWWRTHESAIRNPQSAINSLAVLPFKPLNPKVGDEYLGLGMADTLITRLSGLNRIIVRPTSAVRKYAEQEADPVAAGQELKVEAVLEGSLQNSGDRVRVTVRLLNVSDNRPLWAGTFDEKLTDIFVVQDSISARVAEAMTLRLTGEERQQLSRRETNHPEAYQLYLRGRFFWNKRGTENIKKGVEYFQQALAIDPSYALAWAGLADSYDVLGNIGGLRPHEAFPKAKEAATKALSIDETLAEAHAALAYAKMHYDWDWPGAEREFQRALQLNPNYPTARQWYGEYLTAQGRLEEALQETKQALDLDPLSTAINLNVGVRLFYLHRYDEAITQWRKLLELEPTSVNAHTYIGEVYELQGKPEQAIAEFLQARRLSGDNAEQIAELRAAYAKAGLNGYLQKLLERLNQQSQQGYVRAWELAQLYARSDDKEQAFAWLQKACEERLIRPAGLRASPLLDKLREDARFAELLRRVGL